MDMSRQGSFTENHDVGVWCWLEAYFERNVDDVGTDKGLTCPLYIQELDCAVLYRQSLTPCIVFCISLVTNEGISIQAFLVFVKILAAAF